MTRSSRVGSHTATASKTACASAGDSKIKTQESAQAVRKAPAEFQTLIHALNVIAGQGASVEFCAGQLGMTCRMKSDDSDAADVITVVFPPAMGYLESFVVIQLGYMLDELLSKASSVAKQPTLSLMTG